MFRVNRETNRPPFREDFIEETDARWSFSFESEDPVNNSVGVSTNSPYADRYHVGNTRVTAELVSSPQVYISTSNDLPGAEVNPQHIWNKRVSKLMFVPKVLTLPGWKLLILFMQKSS